MDADLRAAVDLTARKNKDISLKEYEMKTVLMLLILSCCSGCVLVSDAKYQADEAMWQAKAEASKAWAEQSNKPLASFTAVSGETFVVNNPIQAQPMAVTGEPSALVQGADVILNSTVAKIVGGGWAAGYMLGKGQGSYTASGNGQVSVNQDSGNAVNVETRHVEGGGTIANETHTDSDYETASTIDSHDATAEPLIVNPVIVKSDPPVIVQPEIVNPVIVGGE